MTSAPHLLGFAGYRSAIWSVRSLPEAASSAAARAVATAYWRAGSRHIRFACTNLAIALPERSPAEHTAIGRTSFQNFAQSLVDLTRSEHWSLADLLAMHEFTGQEHLERALARGRGAIVLTPHMGNFEFGIRALSASGFKVTAVARKARNPLVDQWLSRRRQEGGAEVIDHRGAARQILRALRGGRIVPLLNDQYVRRHQGVWAPFFGLRASTSPSAAILSQRSGCPVVPMYTIRVGSDRHRIVISEPIDPPARATDRAAAILDATTRYNARLEAMIRESPTQWMWGHRRFRHSPDLAHDPYA